jgi:hypothetical protein
MRAGLSQRALASMIHVHPTLIGKVETAQRFLHPELIARCDDILDADGSLARLHGLVTTERTAPTPPAILATDPAALLAYLVTATATLFRTCWASTSSSPDERGAHGSNAISTRCRYETCVAASAAEFGQSTNGHTSVRMSRAV